ncbi:MAG: DUF58 domain-containing protein [Planctomycetota bacterium]|nr:MAG: DUF58 domain-containing protein [Planctomycetota bacterium]
MEPKELLKKIRRIHIRTSHIANDFFAGHYHSAFKGQGMEFEEVREYEPGDEIRRIDWNVTARQGRPFVKRFREERELTVMLLVDVSGSQEFGTAGQLKRELAAEVGATLAFSAIKNNDKVGFIGFSDRIERYVKPDKGTRHVLRVIRELLTLEPTGRGTDIAGALDYFNKVSRRRAVVFLISDFLADPCDRQMQVARRRHDLIPIAITDPREVELPKVRYIDLVDAETGERFTLDTSSAAFRRMYQARALGRADQRRKAFRRIKADAIELVTGQSFIDPLTRFFHAREARL